MNDIRSDGLNVLWNHSSLPQFARSYPRLAIGISYTPGSRSIETTLVRALGRGVHLVCDILKWESFQLPDDLCKILSHSSPGELCLSRMAQAKADLAEFCASAIRPFIAYSKRHHDDALVIGLHQLGVWIDDRISGSMYEPVCSNSILAETTGITVVDDFPARDLAHGGLGGPTNLLSDWILVGDRSGIPGIRNRGVLRLEEVFRLNLIPNRDNHQVPSNYVSATINPGMNLIRAIYNTFRTSFPTSFAKDYSAQGKIIRPLLEAWQQIPTAVEPWAHDFKLDPRYIQALNQQLEAAESPLQDVYSSAVRYLGLNLCQRLSECIPDSMPISEIILTGTLQKDGAFLSLLKAELPFAVTPSQHVNGLLEIDSAAAAIMAIARIDQLIGNAYRSSKVKVPRCLGRVTPGNPKNWERVTLELYNQLTSILKLKEAV